MRNKCATKDKNVQGKDKGRENLGFRNRWR